jgi:hypothetical protein
MLNWLANRRKEKEAAAAADLKAFALEEMKKIIKANAAADMTVERRRGIAMAGNFLDDILTNKKLEERIGKAIFMDEFIRIGREHGYEFCTRDVCDAVKSPIKLNYLEFKAGKFCRGLAGVKRN